MPPAAIGRAELAAALLRVEDLPAGYTVQPPLAASPPAPKESGGQGAGASPCSDVFEQLRGSISALGAASAAATQVEFSKGDYGPFLQEELLTNADRPTLAAAMEAFRTLPDHCDRFTNTDEQGSFSLTLTPGPLPPAGDESVSLKLEAKGTSVDLDVTLSGYLTLVRKGSVLCTLIHFGIPQVDPQEAEQVVRAAVGRIG